MEQKEVIVAVQKDGNGDIVGFKTSSGKVLTYDQALQAVQNDQIEGANVFTGKNGKPYIRSNADGDPSNNLDNLPTF